MEKTAKMYLLVGPPGSGKSTLRKAVKSDPELQTLIAAGKIPPIDAPKSTTTRKKQEGKAGEDYYEFVTEEQFDQLDFEWTVPYTQRSKRYGTQRRHFSEFLESGKIGLFEVVPHIAAQLQRNYPERVCVIFVLVPESNRRERLYDDFYSGKRPNDDPEVIEKSLAEAKNWEQYLLECDCPVWYVSNTGDLSVATRDLVDIIKEHIESS